MVNNDLTSKLEYVQQKADWKHWDQAISNESSLLQKIGSLINQLVRSKKQYKLGQLQTLDWHTKRLDLLVEFLASTDQQVVLQLYKHKKRLRYDAFITATSFHYRDEWKSFWETNFSAKSQPYRKILNYFFFMALDLAGYASYSGNNPKSRELQQDLEVLFQANPVVASFCQQLVSVELEISTQFLEDGIITTDFSLISDGTGSSQNYRDVKIKNPGSLPVLFRKNWLQHVSNVASPLWTTFYNILGNEQNAIYFFDYRPFQHAIKAVPDSQADPLPPLDTFFLEIREDLLATFAVQFDSVVIPIRQEITKQLKVEETKKLHILPLLGCK